MISPIDGGISAVMIAADEVMTAENGELYPS